MLHPFPPEGPDGTRARNQAIEFLRLAEAAAKGQKYSEAKKQFGSVDHAQVETRKALYEELNLLYVPYGSDKLILTPVGTQLLDLVGAEPVNEPSVELRDRVDALLAWALWHSQILRPQGSGTPKLDAEVRKLCDIRPYAAFWTALRILDGRISFQELTQVLLYVQRVEHFDSAVAAIRKWRETGKLEVKGDPFLPFKTRNSANNHRIYWASHLSIARSLLSVEDGIFLADARASALLAGIAELTSGCGGGAQKPSIAAYAYNSLDDYFERTGRRCPAFIASGQLRLESIEGETIAFLGNYTLERAGSEMIIHGSANLCSLQLNAPCFHPDHTESLLRLAGKEMSETGEVTLFLRPGRPILNPKFFLDVNNGGRS